MSIARAYIRAFGRMHTYDVRCNGFLWFGIGTSLAASALMIPFDGVQGYLSILVHSCLVGLVFGAMGTVKGDLARHDGLVLTELTRLAMTDPLTGLYNRRYVMEELKNMLFRARRSRTAVSVVFFDLDDFKEVNSRRGHGGGDLALKRVADALQSAVRGGETLGRYGGDEFLLVVPDGLPYAEALVGRAVDAVRLRACLSMSAGVARSPEDGATPEALIAAADARLADIKEECREEQSLARR